MKSAKQLITSFVLKEGANYIEKDPVKNFPKLINWAEKLAIREDHKEHVQTIKNVIEEDNNWSELINRVLTELDTEVRKKFLVNYIINSGIYGQPIADELAEKHDCNIPWAILMDPTAACNLSCDGCWAAEYDETASMSIETLDRIIEEGKELGIYMYIYSGGEPLVRKDDLLKLAKKHDDCMFLAFTNGTLIDEEFAKELQKIGNFGFALSVEGYEDETDMRRGEGTFDQVIEAMDILNKYGIVFGFSTCYHSKNTQVVGSDEYIDFMVEKGCMFGWYFTYLPVGQDAVMDLMVSPDQREFMYHRIREAREKHPIFLMDFWNDGEYVDGCIAGGKNYLHINANGDVEPCAFIHYSNVNIKDVSLLEALQSPLFQEYKKGQPFNDNHLRPCPLLDNPDELKQMVHNADAHSTQLVDKESVDDLTDKTQLVAKQWAETADELWAEKNEKEKDQKSEIGG